MESNKLKKLHENGDFMAQRAVMKQDEEAGTQIWSMRCLGTKTWNP